MSRKLSPTTITFLQLVVALFLLLTTTSTSVAFTIDSTNVSTIATKSTITTQLNMTVLSRGAKKMNFKPGSPLKNAVAKLGVKPKYSCKKGDCGSCTISVGGTRVKACVGKVPPEPRLKSLQEKGLEVK